MLSVNFTTVLRTFVTCYVMSCSNVEGKFVQPLYVKHNPKAIRCLSSKVNITFMETPSTRHPCQALGSYICTVACEMIWLGNVEIT